MSDHLEQTGNDDPHADRVQGQAALDAAARQYAAARLRLPPLPRALTPLLQQYGPWHFGTQMRDLTDVAAFRETAQSPTVTPEVGFGHVGHGVNSWWLCYWLILDPVAIELCQSFGGAYGDVAEERASIDRVLEDLPELIVLADAARAAGALPAPQRLTVVLDDRGDSGWGITGGEPQWQPSEDPIAAALDWLS